MLKLCERPSCGNQFTPRSSKARFCSKSCWYSFKSESRPLKICAHCGSEFVVRNRAYLQRGGARFCSYSCSAQKCTIDHTYFDQITSEPQAYWLGMLYADGHNHQNGTGVSLGLQKCDSYLVYALREALHSTHTVHESDTYTTIQLSSPSLSQALAQLGCHQGKKSHTIRFPKLPVPLIRHFIRGFFDGDGWITPRHNKKAAPYWTWGIYSSSSLFIRDLEQLLQEANFRVSLVVSAVGTTLKLSGRSQFPSLLSFLYADATVWLSRKRLLLEQAAHVDQPI